MEQHQSITEYRRANGITLAELAGKFSPPVDKSTLSRWETGVTPIPSNRIAEASRLTGVPVDKLVPDIFGQPEGSAA